MKILPSTSEILGGLLTVEWPRRAVALGSAQARSRHNPTSGLFCPVTITCLEICHYWESWPGEPSQ